MEEQAVLFGLMTLAFLLFWCVVGLWQVTAGITILALVIVGIARLFEKDRGY